MRAPEKLDDCLSAPQEHMPLSQLDNQDGDPISLDQMLICYSQQINLGDLLSYRKLEEVHNGPPISSSYQIRGLGKSPPKNYQSKKNSTILSSVHHTTHISYLFHPAKPEKPWLNPTAPACCC
jgi:hypothetical protein